MESREWLMIISLLIVAIGWFINSHLNRKLEISKKRMDYRLETLHSFLPVYLSITSSTKPFLDDKNLNEKIKKARINFQLYGYTDEIDLFEKFVLAIEEKNTIEASNILNKLIALIRNRIREELNL